MVLSLSSLAKAKETKKNKREVNLNKKKRRGHKKKKKNLIKKCMVFLIDGGDFDLGFVCFFALTFPTR